METLETEILNKLQETLKAQSLRLTQLSDAHKKHREAQKHGGGHYSLHVVSDLFTGLTPLERQKWIYKILENLFKTNKIHALEMTLKSPSE